MDKDKEQEEKIEEQNGDGQETETARRLPWIIGTMKGRVLVALLLVCVCGAAAYYIETKQYRDVEIQESSMRQDEEHLEYIEFGDNLFSYSRDGASLKDYEGTLIWNESFDLEHPACAVSNNYIVVYDTDSTRLFIFSKTGLESNLEMPIPIARADVSETGSVAVLMQQEDAAELKLLDKSGGEIASGKLHMTNTGYPVDIALSGDGTRLAISLLDLNVGDVKSTLNFYDFTEAGRKKENNISAKFSYANMVIPQVDYFDNGEAVAFGDSEVILYTGGDEPGIKKEIFLDEEIKSVLMGRDHFALINARETGEGTVANILTYYDTNGREVFTKPVSKSYTDACFLSNGEILLSDHETINLYTKHGVHKLSYISPEPVLAVMPWDGFRNYYFIKRKLTDKVKLK